MTRGERKKQQISLELGKVRAILRHIRNVHENCLLLGEKLIERGESLLGRKLIVQGFKHDLSKFLGIEWEQMAPGQNQEQVPTAKLKLRLAIAYHNSTNDHHPEFWTSIHEMPRLAVAELVCDWKARSEEFGSSLRDYVKERATKRWKFCEKDVIYKTIMEFVDLLCEKPFSRV